jgi:hypothetical protein
MDVISRGRTAEFHNIQEVAFSELFCAKIRKKDAPLHERLI